MATKFIPLPPINIGGFLYSTGRSSLGLVTILPPHPVSLPLKMEREGVRTAINDYFCSSCKFRLNTDDRDITKDLNPTELSKYCRENSKCPGSKRFATPGCLAGYTQETDMFRVANAEFTTPYLGLDSTYSISSKGTLTKPAHSWKCFRDDTLAVVSPYTNFNVFYDGRTCWGARGVPKDPASAYNEFFTSLTNADLSNCNGHSLKHAIENWEQNVDAFMLTSNKYPSYEILGRTLVKEQHPLTGVLISSNVNWLESVPESELITLPNHEKAFLGWVRKTSTGAEVVCSKNLVFYIENINSKTKKPTLLGKRKEFNF